MQSAEHTCIFGQTGSGKTFLAQVLFKETKGLKIFYNTAHTDYIKKLGQNFDSIDEALDAEVRSIIVNPNMENYVQDMDDLKNWAFEVGDKVGGKPWLTVFVDEAHLVAPKHGVDDMSIRTMWTMGRAKGITMIAITQRCALLNHTIITQSPNYIIFQISDFEKKYLKGYGIPLDSFESHISKKFYYVELKNNEILLHKPVKINRSKKRQRSFKNDENISE